MSVARLFIAQDALDRWVTDGRAEIAQDELRDRETGQRFRLREGVRFLAEVSGAPDAHALVGKVKDLEQLAALQGEHMADSVILGDNAYQVQPGFVGLALPEVATVAASQLFSSAPPLLAPEPAPPNAAPPRQTIAALQAFFLNNVK